MSESEQQQNFTTNQGANTVGVTSSQQPTFCSPHSQHQYQPAVQQFYQSGQPMSINYHAQAQHFTLSHQQSPHGPMVYQGQQHTGQVTPSQMINREQQQFFANQMMMGEHDDNEEVEHEEIVDESMVVAENCVVVSTSSPLPDLPEEMGTSSLQMGQTPQQSYYDNQVGQQAPRIVMATVEGGQPHGAMLSSGQSLYYGQVHPHYNQQVLHQPRQQPHYVIVEMPAAGGGNGAPGYSGHIIHHHQSHHYQPQQMQSFQQQQAPHHQQCLPTPQIASQMIRRTTPFEEEEEEDEDEDEEFEDEVTSTSSNSNIVKSGDRTYSVQFGGSTREQSNMATAQRFAPKEFIQPKVSLDEQRMTRAGRRKQIFEKTAKSVNARMNEEGGKSKKISTAGGQPVKKGTADQTKPLFDKTIASTQALQRLQTAEGWRKMNDWLKAARNTMDLARLRQLLNQLNEAKISVDLLRSGIDTPKLIKDLQKCADKDIANMATKLVNKWKQTVRDKNEADVQQKQKQAAEKIASTTATKGPKTGATTAESGDKLLRRSSQSLDSETAEGMPAGSNSNPKLIGSDKTASAQIRGRTGSGTGTVSSQQQQLGARTSSLGNNGASKQATGETERPKVVAKAKAKISRPRLTGLEDEPTAGKQRSGSFSKPTTTSPTSVTSPINESPLSKIMAATAKFQAQEQAKRKPADLVFSDNFMDSLSAVDNVKPKKAKIVRKKVNPSVMGTTTGSVHAGTSKSASSDTTAAAATAETSTGPAKRRVRFCDEIGRQLVEERTFEIEEGERINVTKMDKETLKHFDSQREKQFLLDARRHGFGMAAAGVGGQPGSSFSSLTDPSLMPPGHGRILGTTQTQAASTPQIGQKKMPEILFPWKLHVVEFQSSFTVEPGCKSEAKLIEMERQRTSLPSLVLPNSQPPPISELSDEDLRRQREEGLEHVPKIIPLEMITDVVEPQTQIGNGALLNKEEPMEEDQQEPKPDVEEKMEEDDRCESPVAPAVHRLSSGSSEDEADSETENKPKVEAKQEELAIASPEPEPDESAQHDSSTDSVKEIPTEQIRSSNEDEDQDMRDISVADSSLGQIRQQRQAEGSPNVPTSSGTAPAAFKELIKTNPNLSFLLNNLKHKLGDGDTSASAEALDTSGKSSNSNLASMTITPVGVLLSGLSMAQTPVQIPTSTATGINIPPPPTHLYPHRPPIGYPPTTLSPHQQFLSTPQQISPHIQQQMLMSGQRTPIVGGTPLRAGVPLPDFTKPPPNFGRFPPPPPHTTAMGFPPAQLGPGQLAPTLLSGATIQASNLPQLKPGTPQKDETSSTHTPTAAGNLISPGPPGFNEGGSTPSTTEHQQTPAGPGVPQIPPPVQSPYQPLAGQPQASPFPQQQSPQQPIISVAEARKMVGECAFFMRTKTCDYGDKCKFAHDEGTMTLGVQMALRGVNIAARGGAGFRGRGGRGGFGPSGRGGFRGGPEGGGPGGSSFEDRQPRRGGATGGRGGYDLSPIRDGGGGRDSFRDRGGRRFRSSPTRRRRYSRSRSRSRDRYSRRRRSRSRDRDRGSGGRERRSKSRTSSNSSSTSTYSRSRSPTPRRQRDERKESSSRRDSSRERRRRSPAERKEQRQQRYQPRSKSPASRRRSSSSSSNTSIGQKRVENTSANSNGNAADAGVVESQPESQVQVSSEEQPTGTQPPAPQPAEKPVIEVIID